MTVYRMIEQGDLEAVEFLSQFRIPERAVRSCLGNPGEPYLSVGEVKKLFRISKGTVYRMIEQGELEAVRLSNLFRIPERSVNKLLG
jgi:excisionase family DNA binding protein